RNDHGTTETTAKLVSPQRGLGKQANSLVIGAPRVQYVVFQVIVSLTMKLIGSCARGHLKIRNIVSSRSAKVAHRNSCLRQGIRRWRVAYATLIVLRGI